ncbi:MAG: periplasmic heavy metal sensor [Gammaproteobacteria bacterium]|nr:periplasmic heavy metal sensor [Gammaproteobacteria bacterium]
MRTKWLVGVLIVSVVLNVAAVGFLAGFLGKGKPSGRVVDPTVGLALLMRNLPDERRQELVREGAPVLSDGELRRSIRVSMRELRNGQRTIGQAIAAEPFDPEALADALARYREHFDANQAGNHQAFVDILARLTPEERRRFLATMHTNHHRRGLARPPRGHQERPRPQH